MTLMENGRMDSTSEVTSDSSHIIMSLGGKSVKSCLSNDSAVMFQNTNAASIENTFTNCNGNSTNSTVDLCETSNLMNGVNACNNNCEENLYNSPNRIHSSQCNLSSVQSIENNLSTLSIKADTGDAPCGFTCNQRSDLSSKKCDNLCVRDDCQEESNRDCQSRDNEPKVELYPDSNSAQILDESHCGSEMEKEDANSSEVMYISYESEHQMPDIMKLIQKDLSEPYSIYTYRYFIHNWPHLCFLAVCKARSVGAIVCKLDIHRKVIRRGYIAMLAVDESYRKHGIGSNLVLKAIRVMAAEGADEVVLETEITNQPALRLYENLGFVRDKRLFRYYLNGVDALRLKLWLR